MAEQGRPEMVRVHVEGGRLAGVAGGLQSTAMRVGLVTNVTHTTFISGMSAAFAVAAVVALAGAVLALPARRGRQISPDMRI